MFLFSVIGLTSTLNIPEIERHALRDLYLATNGIYWEYRQGGSGHWDFTDPEVNPCSSEQRWQGVNCSVSSTHYSISQLSLSRYNLSGSIPHSLGMLGHLLSLNMSCNSIEHTIPATIGNLSELRQLDLSVNSLSGSLPSSLYRLSKLQWIDLTYNTLNGTLSNSVGDLQQLQRLTLLSNHLTGTLPEAIGNLTQLNYLRLSANQFNGTIPGSFANLHLLTLFIFGYNKLSGTIPEWIGELSSVSIFSLNDNKLNGTVPSAFCRLPTLTVLYISNNRLSGTIPSCLGRLTNLTTFRLSGNQLSGSVPTSISGLASLVILDVSHNQLTGTIPDWVGSLPSLQTLGMAANFFSSSIPSSISQLSSLQLLFLSDNVLTGTITELFSSLSALLIIQLNHNRLTGTVPSSIALMHNLTMLFLQDNRFTGDLDKVFNGSYQRKLNNVQLSNNQFTGQLPDQLFLSGSLVAFSAVSNCFEGSIPPSICSNKRLVSLAMDGLGCASSCRRPILGSISAAYVSIQKISGGIPLCLWSQPLLQVLHMSGNSLTGSLPTLTDEQMTDSLVDLSLSQNMLTGSIPSYIQERAWRTLDLSHNRMSGTLRSYDGTEYSNVSSISMSSNRLSGRIPSYLRSLSRVVVLEGNSFDCLYDRSDLPLHDTSRGTYECGSKSFDIMCFAWLGCTAVVAAGVCWVLLRWERMHWYGGMVRAWQWMHFMEHATSGGFSPEVTKLLGSMRYFKQYYNLTQVTGRFSLYCTAFIIVLLLPLYTVLSTYYSTHTYEYAWTLSILFLSGKEAFAVCIAVLTSFVFSLVALFCLSLRDSSFDLSLTSREDKWDLLSTAADRQRGGWRTVGMIVAYIAGNLFVVSGVNTAYVYVALYQSRQVLVLAQLLLSLFKLTWNTVVSPRMIRCIIYILSTMNVQSRVFQRRLFVMQLMVSLLNNIVIPCLIVATVSPNCFYHVFHPQADVTSSFQYTNCAVYTNDGQCFLKVNTTASTSYSPPFIYSYQCSSDFVTYYSSVFLFLCIISAFIIPLLDMTLIRLSRHYQWMTQLIELGTMIHSTEEAPAMESIDDTATTTAAAVCSPPSPPSAPPMMPIDEVYEFFVSQLTYIGLLITFGTVFPLLAVPILVAIYRRLYYHRGIIGRYISLLEVKGSAGTVASCLAAIERDCKVQPLLSTIQRCGWALLSLACCFYSAFLFDTLGDEAGFYRSYWVLVAMPLLPLCIYGAGRLLMLYYDLSGTCVPSYFTTATTTGLRTVEGMELCKTTSAAWTPNPMTSTGDGGMEECRDSSLSGSKDTSYR